MFKLIGHLVVFVIGAGAGIWWGVYHPTEAQELTATEHAKIESAVAIAKRDLLQKVVAEQSADAPASGTAAAVPATANHLSTYQEWLKKASEEVKNSGTNLLTPTQNQ
jgi:cytoskeletal protein RodZ